MKKWLRKRRMICLYGVLIPSHSASLPSAIANQCCLAAASSCAGRRCESSALTQRSSAVSSAASRMQRARTSPTAGPPSTRVISLVLPPSSETGST
jgi:hypothetical protein